MPLRDHFRSPLADRRSWDGFHGQWPAMIVIGLSRKLPRRYVAEPLVHLGSSIEIDVGTFEDDDESSLSGERDDSAGASTAVWAPPEPTLAVATDLLTMDAYEVRVYDTKSGRRLVAAVEIVSPANKDRPENRRAFVAKCHALLQSRVCVAIVDLVTTRTANLYSDLMELFGQTEPSFADDGPPPLYAVTCRSASNGGAGLLETWTHPLALGQPLPTLPLWLAPNLAVALELELSYEETCHILRIP
jgi:Protein of unknown function (DUF4058)